VEVRWPSGQLDVFKNLEVNRLYVVQEGNKVPEARELAGFKRATP
jgi:enediyne biosynthesis protein E4